jgi:mono/diheme cytochrome c family protein
VDLCVDARLDARLYEHMKVFVSAILLVALLCESAAAEDGEAQFSSEQITRGAALFARHCATCHGTRMRNPQWAVNLRDFPRNAHGRFVDSVTNGKRNMPSWEDVLHPDEIEALWAYVIRGEAGD